MPEELWQDLYRELKQHWWGLVAIATAILLVVAFAVWNSLPDSKKEAFFARESTETPARTACSLDVDSFSFEQGSPYLSGIADIRLDTLVPSAIQRLEQCGITYRVERDGPTIYRIEVTPESGLLSGVTYYALNNVINTIGFTLASDASHLDLRQAARRQFGPPDRQSTFEDLNYDEWTFGGIRLSIFENGGSFFSE